jgi:hypothetical protein
MLEALLAIPGALAAGMLPWAALTAAAVGGLSWLHRVAGGDRE